MQKSESEIEKVKVRSSCQAVAMQKVKVNVRKLLPCCCHVKKWKWKWESESEKVKVRSSFQAVAMLLPCKKWKWTSESESEKQFPTCCHAVAMQKVKVNVRKWKWKAVAKLLTCCCHAKSESKREKVKVRTCCCYAVTCSTRGIAAEYFVSSLLSMKVALMYLPHRKQNCRCTTAEVPLLGRIIFSKIVSQCFDKSFKLDPCCLAPHNDRLLPTDYQALQHNWDLGKCARLLMSKWTWMRQSLTFATLLSVFFAPCSILKKRQPAVF